MRKIKNAGEIIAELKSLLKQYLEENDTVFKGSLFTCPNYKDHSNNDSKPSAGFVPDTEETVWHCFACGKSGTIFDAVHYLEDKQIKGAQFYFIVKWLADKYSIDYKLEELTQREKEFEIVQRFLQALVKNAHRYLKNEKPKKAIRYLKKRGWLKVVDKFQIGYLPEDRKIKNFFTNAFKEHPEIKNYINIEDYQIIGRIIYPIMHRHGNSFLGITHRAIEDKKDGPKYVKHFLKNLEKRGVLFNLTNIYREVYIVEGGSSVLTLSRVGMNNVVAILGSKFTEQMYNSLVKAGVKKAVFVFDGDKAGLECLEKTVKLTQNKSDIKVFVKILPKGKDPDDIVNEKDLEAFKKIPKVSSFKYQISKLKKDIDAIEVKHSLYEMILSQNDSLIQDRMLRYFSKELGILKSLIIEELRRYETQKNVQANVGISAGEILEEKESLAKDIDKFEERAWRTDRLLGPSTGFPILDEKLDGLQDGLHLVGGKWNMGKSAYLVSLALNLLKNPNNYVLYFSIDDAILTKTIPRILANMSHIPINTVANPLWKIQKNETLSEINKVKVAQQREGAIKELKTLTQRFGLKDASHGYDIDFVEKMVKIYNIIAEGRKLVVFIDFLNMLHINRLKDRTEIETRLAGALKHLSGLYNIPIVATVEATKSIGDRGITDKDIKGSSAIHHKADTIMLLWSNFEEDKQSDLYFYDDEGKAFPIVQIRLAKNKISGFRGSIYFKFYTDLSRFEEVSEEDQKKYWRG